MKYNQIVQHHDIKFENIAGEKPHLVELGPSVESQSLHQTHHKAKKASGKRRNLHLEHKPSDETDLLIQSVNEADLGWKADVCKYQKHHANYGAHCDSEAPVTLAQVSDTDEQEEEEQTPTKKEFGVEGD